MVLVLPATTLPLFHFIVDCDFSQVNVLAYEYSGYGKSEGTVSEDNCYADIRAAYDYLTTQKKTPPKQIVL